MNESTLTGLLAGAAVVTAGLGFASLRILEGETQFAEVLAVQPVVETVRRAREECPEELVVATPLKPTVAARPIVTATARSLRPAAARAADARPSCRTVYESIRETVGYDVVYRLDDRQGTVRMDHDPGERIPVKNGELVLTAASP